MADRKFSDDEIRTIWNLWMSTDLNYSDIARQFRVSHLSIRSIIKRRSYKELAPEDTSGAPFPRRMAQRKLSAVDVAAIQKRSIHESGAQIARDYDITPVHARRVANRQWKLSK